MNFKPVLNQINLIARDFEAMVEFYRRLGLEISEAPEDPGGIRHAAVKFQSGLSLELDNRELARLYHAGWRRPEGGSRVLIGFSLPSREAVDQLFGELAEAGYEARQSPYDAFWGARYAIVADPDGNDVGLMSPLDEGRRTWPAQESPDV